MQRDAAMQIESCDIDFIPIGWTHLSAAGVHCAALRNKLCNRRGLDRRVAMSENALGIQTSSLSRLDMK